MPLNELVDFVLDCCGFSGSPSCFLVVHAVEKPHIVIFLFAGPSELCDESSQAADVIGQHYATEHFYHY